MRKIIVLTFLTLDGVMQAPGGPEEDTSGGFTYGGWTVPYSDNFLGEVVTKQMSQPFDLLLGRKTYEIFAGYWPHANPVDQPIAPLFNNARKYVASKTMKRGGWKDTTILSGNLVEEVRNLKARAGPDLQVYGSGNLVQTLLSADLVDELWLKIFPITLGTGKKLFAGGTIPAAFRLIECKASPAGVIVASYERAGEVRTGSFT